MDMVPNNVYVNLCGAVLVKQERLNNFLEVIKKKYFGKCQLKCKDDKCEVCNKSKPTIRKYERKWINS